MPATRPGRSALVPLALATLAVAGCATPTPTAIADERAAAAQAIARHELDAIHAILRDGHPGAIDDEHPEYRERIESGYRASMARLPEVREAFDAMSLADWYVARFQDGHLTHSNGIRVGDPTVVNGWHVARDEQGRVRVVAVLPDWPVPLPPVGAELSDCDGRSPERLVAENVLPYLTPVSAAMRDLVTLNQLSRPAMAILRPSTCRFRLADGELHVFAQRHESVGEDRMYELLTRDVPAARRPSGTNDMERLPDGTVWVHAADFKLDAAGEAHLETLVDRLEQIRAPRRIVFDARGNTGGNSGVGQRIFDAATGGLVFDIEGLDALPRVQAWWRVSPTTIRALDYRIETARGLFGADSPQARQEIGQQATLREAMARGDRWWLQGSGQPMLTFAELRRRHAHLARVTAPVVLLTDSACASACLDFADLVRSVPGAIHVGETTSFDSVYIEQGLLQLPSGNALNFPLKVWRHRVRGNDQPWTPDIPLAVTGRDDSQVRADVLAALDREAVPMTTTSSARLP
jgi:hypothetical protein